MQNGENKRYSIDDLWSAITALSLIVAAVCWWQTYLDAAFVVAALGVVAWFVSLRNRLRKSHIEAEDVNLKTETEIVDD